jgi:predicted short-subunit dehydrogenase-like oxidoreductase (DUF2520 family)
MVLYPIRNIVIIGTGNVATHLASAYHNSGSTILNVFGRNPEKANQLAKKVDSIPVSQLQDMDPSADIYIIAVSDDAIADVARDFPFNDRLIVHTSGTTPIDIFKPYQQKFGVLYPLQTLTKGILVDFKTVPFCIEACDDYYLNLLESFAFTITKSVFRLTSEERRIAHLAAVIANNFTNHLYGIAFELLISHKIPAEIILPLINETARKAGLDHPFYLQTGPASRDDQRIIDQQLADLSDKPEYQEIYRILSNSIKQKKSEL